MEYKFQITPFDGKCQNLQIFPTHFCASSYCFRDIIFYLKKRSRSWRSRSLSAITPFDDKCQIYKRHFFVFDFCQDMTYADDFNRHTHTHTHRQTLRQTQKRTSPIVQICLKRPIVAVFCSPVGSSICRKSSAVCL